MSIRRLPDHHAVVFFIFGVEKEEKQSISHVIRLLFFFKL